MNSHSWPRLGLARRHREKIKECGRRTGWGMWDQFDSKSKWGLSDELSLGGVLAWDIFLLPPAPMHQATNEAEMEAAVCGTG